MCVWTKNRIEKKKKWKEGSELLTLHQFTVKSTTSTKVHQKFNQLQQKFTKSSPTSTKVHRFTKKVHPRFTKFTALECHPRLGHSQSPSSHSQCQSISQSRFPPFIMRIKLPSVPPSPHRVAPGNHT